MPSHNHQSDRTVARVAKQHLSHLDNNPFTTITKEFDRLTKKIEKDFDRTFTRFPSPMSFFERTSDLISDPLMYQPVRSFYEKKTIVQGDDGRTIVKTVKKSPGRPWQTHVEEFTNNQSLEQGRKHEALEQEKNTEAVQQEDKTQQTQGQNNDVEIVEEVIQQDKGLESQTQKQDIQIVEEPVQDQGVIQDENIEQVIVDDTEDKMNEEVAQVENQSNALESSQNNQIAKKDSSDNMLSLFDREFKRLSRNIGGGFSPLLHRRNAFDAFDSWDLWDPEPIHFDPERTSYRLKSIVDNNGDVTIKTASKNPGSEWKTSTKHYSAGSSIEDKQKPKAIAEQAKNNKTLSAKKDKTKKAKGSERAATN